MKKLCIGPLSPRAVLLMLQTVPTSTQTTQERAAIVRTCQGVQYTPPGSWVRLFNQFCVHVTHRFPQLLLFHRLSVQYAPSFQDRIRSTRECNQTAHRGERLTQRERVSVFRWHYFC